jgi:glucose/arabinose dehydrogenase
MRVRVAATLAACAASIGVIVAVASAASVATPKAYGGAKVSAYATTGLTNVTSVAWVGKTMFAGSSGDSQSLPNGGVFVVKDGKGTKISSKLLFVAGMELHGGALYLSGGVLRATGPVWQIQAWRGWNGTTFTSQKVLYSAPKGFDGFNGLAFGPDGRLYVGVDLGLTDGNDHAPAGKTPYLYDILSMSAKGKDVKVFAKGIRQPWQMAFAAGSGAPFVSDLGQDSGAKNPPDFLLRVKQGQNYGFPKCNWTPATKKACKKAAKPFETFSPHFDPMGLAIIGSRLYITSWMGLHAKGAGAVYETSIKGGKLAPVVTGLPFASDALAAHNGNLYVAGASAGGSGPGMIFRIKP